MATSSWQVDDLGSVADQACWALFAVTAGKYFVKNLSFIALDEFSKNAEGHGLTTALVIVTLRVICRLFLKRGPHGGIGLDDYITIFCVLVLLVTCVLVNIGSSHGLGRHMKTLEPEQIVQANRWNVIISSVLIWSFSLPKFAMVAILKRILNYGLKTTIVFWFLALSSQACILATSVWWWKQCTPMERGWDRTIEGTCAPVSVLANLGYFTSAYSAFLDIFFAMYPIPFVMRLNMPLKSRIAVSVALGLSALACIVSIYKLAIFGEIFEILAVDPTCKLAANFLKIILFRRRMWSQSICGQCSCQEVRGLTCFYLQIQYRILTSSELRKAPFCSFVHLFPRWDRSSAWYETKSPHIGARDSSQTKAKVVLVSLEANGQGTRARNLMMESTHLSMTGLSMACFPASTTSRWFQSRKTWTWKQATSLATRSPSTFKGFRSRPGCELALPGLVAGPWHTVAYQPPASAVMSGIKPLISKGTASLLNRS